MKFVAIRFKEFILEFNPMKKKIYFKKLILDNKFIFTNEDVRYAKNTP
jgi:hypothetical protein